MDIKYSYIESKFDSQDKNKNIISLNVLRGEGVVSELTP